MTEFFRKLTRTDTRTILAVLATLGMFSFVGLLFVVKVPRENVALLNTLLPMMVSGIVGLSFGFYFGNSKSNQNQDEQEKKQ